MRKLFIDYTNPHTGKWTLVGCLEYDEVSNYKFYYVQGIDLEENSKINGFPHLEFKYNSSFLFPFFSNRLMPKTRPDYANYINYLGLDPEHASPIEIIGADGGRKVTDQYGAFLLPHMNCDGNFSIDFFVDLTSDLKDLTIKDKLYLTRYRSNSLRTVLAIGRKQDTASIIGECPDWISKYIPSDNSRFKISIIKVNPAPAYFSKRLQCRLSFDDYSFGSKLYQGSEFQSYVHPD